MIKNNFFMGFSKGCGKIQYLQFVIDMGIIYHLSRKFKAD